jgi:hypothetical protein
VLAKLGIAVPCTDIFGGSGSAWLDGLDLPQPYAGKVDSLCQLMAALSGEVTLMEQVTGDLLTGHEGYHAIQDLPGIGPVLGAVIVAEIGDIRRFPGPGQLASWVGLTPRHRESDVKVTRGHVTKQGPRTLRWGVVEAIQRQPVGTRARQAMDAVLARRGREAKTSPRSPPPASCCATSSTPCATAASAALPDPGGPHEPARGPRPGARSPSILPPAGGASPGGASVPVIDPARPGANPPHALPAASREHAKG